MNHKKLTILVSIFSFSITLAMNNTNIFAEEQQNLPKTQETTKLLNETIDTVSSESTRATEYNYGDFEYSINDDTITITGYTENKSAVIIPSEIDSKKSL